MSDDNYRRMTGQRLPTEETQFEQARRELPRNPPVTVLEDLIGGMSEAKGQSNALRDAIRQGIIDRARQSGYGGPAGIEKYGYSGR
jgi:hypothetical protein